MSIASVNDFNPKPDLSISLFPKKFVALPVAMTRKSYEISPIDVLRLLFVMSNLVTSAIR
jgi:hypothetical protein